jgi:opacity protein-like surface antigen
VDTELKFTGQELDGRKFDQSKVWADPVVGARLRAVLYGKWFVSLIGDVGGFGLNSDVTWQAFAGVGYQITETFVLKVGYRAIGVDYSKDGFRYDIVEYGPLLGLGIRF